eukprot:11550452-Heterocapsa_arctica.AAC.1
MQHDVDDTELACFRERAMDRTEWGGYEQIIMWNKIYQINLTIYCYSMNMQTLVGDTFILDKE